MTKISTAAVTALALVLALALVPVAAAQSSLDGYSDVGGNVQDKVDTPPPADQPASDIADTEESGEAPTSDVAGDVQTSSGESLPFTGLDVLLLVAAGAVLIGLGLGMRRLTSPSSP